jgi:hypothetical protein
LAISYRERGDLEAAVRTANQAMARYRELLLDREVGLLENELALTYMGLGSLDRASTYASAADARLRDRRRARPAHVSDARPDRVGLGATSRFITTAI